MSDLKTKKNKKSVPAYLKSVTPERRDDCAQLVEIMSKITRDEGAMWGPQIVGFGSYHYTYASGREGDWFLTGFSSRKQAISLYMMAGFEGREELMGKLGKHKVGKSCLYIKSLDDIHIPTLKKIIRESVKAMKLKYQ